MTARVLGAWWFRALFAIACLAVHLKVCAMMGERRFHVPFNAAPSSAPAFVDPRIDKDAHNAMRLVVSRWDGGHYVGMALRGYTQCPQSSLAGQDLMPYVTTCDLSFFPAYPLVGRLASLGGRIPIDYALLGVSLVSSLLLMMMWTSRAITSQLGLFATWASLVAYNCFTTGFTLVTLQTEPLFLALTLGAFLALDRRLFTLGALLAGAATSIRVSGAMTGFAYGVALLVVTYRERPASALAWARRGAELLLPAWGLVATLAYNRVRFGDAFVYFRAHEQMFRHSTGLTTEPERLLRSLDMPLHEGTFLVVMLLLFLLGHRDALRRFTTSSQAYFYALVASWLVISVVGSFSLAFAGMNRYMLHAMPLFFAIGALMKKRPAMMIAWLAFNAWHYWQVDACFYVGGPGNYTLQQCNDAHWIGHL